MSGVLTATRPATRSPITYHYDVEQGSDEWFAMRLGVLTASEMKHVLTPTLKVSNNDKTRQHVFELLAQRISQHIEPSYISDAMYRGIEEELDAKILYNAEYAPIRNCGFIVNNRHGFKLGYSPDGLIGDGGLIEVKSRAQKYQVQTIVQHVWNDKSKTIPGDFLLQVQTGLLVSERKWLDFLSYSGGLPMVCIRVHPDDKVHEAILEAATEFEAKIQACMTAYQSALNSGVKLLPTERREEEEIMI